MSLNNSNNPELIKVRVQYQDFYYEGLFIDNHLQGWCERMYQDENGVLVSTGLEVFFDENGIPGQERPIQNNVEYNNNNLEANIYSNNENNNNYNEEEQFKNIDEIGDNIKAKAESFHQALLSYFNNHKDPANEEYRKKIFGPQNDRRNPSVLKDTLASFLCYNLQIANMDFNNLNTDIISNVARYVDACYIYAWSYKCKISKFMLNENLKQKLVNGIYRLYDQNCQGDYLKQSLLNLIDYIDCISQDLDIEKQFLLANQNNVDVLNQFCEQLKNSIEGDSELELGEILIPLNNERVVTNDDWQPAKNQIVVAIKDIIKYISKKIIPINKNINTHNQLLNINNPQISQNNPLNNNINQVGNNQFVNNLNLNLRNNIPNQNVQNNQSNNNPLNNNNFNMPVIHNIRNDINNIQQEYRRINEIHNLEDLDEQEYNNFIQDVLNNNNTERYRNKMIENPQRFQNMTNVCWLRRLFCCCSNPNEIELDNIVRKKIEANAVKLSCNDIIEQYRGI